MKNEECRIVVETLCVSVNLCIFQNIIVGAVPQCPPEMDIQNQREGMETLPYDKISRQKEIVGAMPLCSPADIYIKIMYNCVVRN